MEDPVEINVTEPQLQMLRAIASRIYRPFNVAAHQAVSFVDRVVAGGAERIVMRNEQRRLQRDIYIGKGITLSHIERPDEGKPAASFHIEGSAREYLRRLVALGFAENSAAAVGRAIWTYSEVVTGSAEPGWALGFIAEGRFDEVTFGVISRIDQESARAGIEEFVRDARRRTRTGPLTADERKKTSIYLMCDSIPADEKLRKIKEIISADEALFPDVRLLSQVLALDSTQVAKIRTPWSSLFGSPTEGVK